jgi:hypothetical protein
MIFLLKRLGRPEINSRPVAVSGLFHVRGRTAEPARSGRGPEARPCPPRGAERGRRRPRARRRGGGCGRPAISGREQAGQGARENRDEVANPFLELGR